MTVYQNISFGLSNVKEALPKIDFEAKNAARACRNPEERRATLSQSSTSAATKTESWKKRRPIIKLIDALYPLACTPPRRLFDYHLESPSSDCACRDRRPDRQGRSPPKKTAQDAGCTLDDEFRYVKDGEIVTQVRKLTKEEIDLSVRRVSRIVKIGMFMDRYPAELSGGQQQRVAIARTLAPGAHGAVHGRAALEPGREAAP